MIISCSWQPLYPIVSVGIPWAPVCHLITENSLHRDRGMENISLVLVRICCMLMHPVCCVQFRFGIFEHTSWNRTFQATQMRYLIRLITWVCSFCYCLLDWNNGAREYCKVYAVDWSPDGEKVASGGKDRVLKLWMNWRSKVFFGLDWSLSTYKKNDGALVTRTILWWHWGILYRGWYSYI